MGGKVKSRAVDKRRVSSNAQVEEKPQPTPKRQAAIAAARERLAEMPLRPGVVMTRTDHAVKLAADHADNLGNAIEMQAALGSSSPAFVDVSLAQLIAVAHQMGERCDSDDLSHAVAFIAAVAPENEMESALAQQMLSVHRLAMTMAIRAGNTDRVDHCNTYVNLATKLQRTFACQLDALGKMRRGGEQVVRHIHVDNRGGQAIIAETVNTGGSNGSFIEQACEQYLGGDGRAALPSQDTQGHRMPATGIEGQKALQAARRPVDRGTEG